MTKEVKESKKKITVALIIVAVVLILLAILLFWFFNRKFNVTFKVDDSENYTIQVKYNQTIQDEDIKDEEQLGEYFIGWYEVISVENDEETLAEESFDFSQKIKSEKTLKAVYEEEPVVEEGDNSIKITFDSKGGSKVKSIILEKGDKLTFPKNPTRSGYTFVAWTNEKGKTVKNKTKFQADTVLYAKWDKVEETKQQEPEQEPVKEEKISLSLSRTSIHRNGYNTSKATAKVENASGDVTYSIDNSDCVSIDSKTGELKADEAATGGGTKVRLWYNKCAADSKVINVTASLPSGKSTTAKLTLEKDLILYASWSNHSEKDEVTSNNQEFPAYQSKFSIDSNQSVTWTAKADSSNGCVTKSPSNVKGTQYSGVLDSQCSNYTSTSNTFVTATTAANQKLTVKYYAVVA